MRYKIQGGATLHGEIRALGNKNSALPCLAAALLTDEEVILHNIPRLQDVNIMVNILEHIGASVSKDKNSYKIKVSSIQNTSVPHEFSSKIRASILFAGPMLARCKKVVIFPPGGDVIGRRRLDTHIASLSALGAEFTINHSFTIRTKGLKGTHIFQDEASVTATENTIMAAVLAKGVTVIENSACEPHVQDLCNMLVTMGANITGIGSNILHIKGVKKLHGTEFTIGPDFMEVGSLIGLASVTKSEIAITHTEPQHMKISELQFGKLGIHWHYEGKTVVVPKKQKRTVVPDLGGVIPTIADAPWPSFPPDLISIILVVATQTNGSVLIHEKMFESRLFFTDKLIGMGARIILCDPHRALVQGPRTLIGTQLSSPDVRAGMAMVLAALCAEGESIIDNTYEIERGYENLTQRLHKLGAKIQKIS